MAGGSRVSGSSNSKNSKNYDVPKRVSSKTPPFSLSDIKKAIPSHCYHRSLLLSISYVVYDLAVIFLFYHISTNYIHLIPYPLSYFAWPIYWFCQGCMLVGLWVIGHECGHHAFSNYQWLDNIVGLILHSIILTPYFSWKYSHRRHHLNIASIERDEIFVPQVKSKVSKFLTYNSPLPRFLKLVFLLNLGWPLYMMFNMFNSLGAHPYDQFASHFYPYSPIFTNRERFQIYISDAGIISVVYGLYRLIVVRGLTWVLCVYGGPIQVMNAWLVVITLLNHTHPSLPHYDSSEWDWLRGTLSTVDRDFGIFNKVFHNVMDTHVVHHLVSTMPHYHAKEATEAIKPILGDYYLFDGTPILKAIWREVERCIYVEPDENDERKGVYWYKY